MQHQRAICFQYIEHAQKQLEGLEGMLEAARLATDEDLCAEAERLQLFVRKAARYAEELGRKMKMRAMLEGPAQELRPENSEDTDVVG